MITGHCTEQLHERCPAPGRCSCTCHGARPEPETAPRRPIERAPGEYRCTACTSDFRTQADLDHHRQTIHEPPKETIVGGNTSKPLDENCPTCGAHFATTGQRGAHYRYNPDHARPGSAPTTSTRPQQPTAAPLVEREAPPDPADATVVEVFDRTWQLTGGTIRLGLELAVDPTDAEFITNLMQLVRELDDQFAERA